MGSRGGRKSKSQEALAQIEHFTLILLNDVGIPLFTFGKVRMVLLIFLVEKVGKGETVRSSLGARPQITVS